jgi:hypothetical protein
VPFRRFVVGLRWQARTRVARTGPGEADTFTFGTTQYAAKVTRVGADADLSSDVIPAANFANSTFQARTRDPLEPPPSAQRSPD